MARFHNRAAELPKDLTPNPNAEWRDGQLEAIQTFLRRDGSATL